MGKVEGVDGECPNIFSLDGRQVLIRSTYPISYLIGDFDPDAIALDLNTQPRVLDYGYGGEEMPSPLQRGMSTAPPCSPIRPVAPSCWVG